MTEPLERDSVLPGNTYKLKWPSSDHAFYITINDIVRDSRRRPFEIFINTKDLSHFAWTVALTRMISAIFRRGGDVSFVSEELKAIFDPQGGGQWMSGTYVPSLLAAIGGIIETHLAASEATEPIRQTVLANTTDAPNSQGDPMPSLAPSNNTEAVQPKFCPRCSQPNYRMEGLCRVCLSCGHSSCG